MCIRDRPVLRAGFTDMFVTGIPTRWTSVRQSPMATGARADGARLSVAPIMTKRKKNERTTSTTSAAKYSAPTVDAEYLSALWNADVESVRRTKSGAVASDVYNNKIVAERSYMQASSTRVVTFEMCGNDGLQARSSFKSQTGTCNFSVLATAEANCKTYVAKAMDLSLIHISEPTRPY